MRQFSLVFILDINNILARSIIMLKSFQDNVIKKTVDSETSVKQEIMESEHSNGLIVDERDLQIKAEPSETEIIYDNSQDYLNIGGRVIRKPFSVTPSSDIKQEVIEFNELDQRPESIRGEEMIPPKYRIIEIPIKEELNVPGNYVINRGSWNLGRGEEIPRKLAFYPDASTVTFGHIASVDGADVGPGSASAAYCDAGPSGDAGSLGSGSIDVQSSTVGERLCREAVTGVSAFGFVDEAQARMETKLESLVHERDAQDTLTHERLKRKRMCDDSLTNDDDLYRDYLNEFNVSDNEQDSDNGVYWDDMKFGSVLYNEQNSDDWLHRDYLNEFKSFSDNEQNNKFEWKTVESFHGRKEAFLVEKTGPTQNFQEGYQAFRAIWTDYFLNYIAWETNRYAASVPRSEKAFHAAWYDTSAHEILLLFAFWIMLGVIKMPTISSCFSLNPLLKTGVFRRLFCQKRYYNLNKAIHFSSPGGGDSDRMHLLRPVIDHLNTKFQELYVPRQSICVDESLTPSKGLAFWKNVTTKGAKLKFKSYELCEAATGYLWSFLICAEKETPPELTVRQNIINTVLKLIRPLLGKGYTLFIDGSLNSPLLARFLKRNRTDCVGTLQEIPTNIPPLLSVPLREGRYIALHSDDVVIIAIQNTKLDYLLSTHHNIDQTATKKGRYPVNKLHIVSDYKVGMGGVDKKKQMLGSQLGRKQHLKWHKKIFRRLLNASVQNSRVLLERLTEERVNNSTFRLDLVQEIIKHHLPLRPREPIRLPEADYSGLNPCRYVCTPSKFHSLSKSVKKPNPDDPNPRRTTEKGHSKNSRKCVYCRIKLKKCSKTVYECSLCEAPLCLDPCFRLYHTTV